LQSSASTDTPRATPTSTLAEPPHREPQTARGSGGRPRIPTPARRLGIRLARQALRRISPVSRLVDLAPPRQPIFLIGCPRSGTSLLYAILQNSSELAGLPGEGHVLWESLHHPKYHGWQSNALEREHAGKLDRDFSYAVIRAIARRRRFLDKTPKNSLRIPYLAALFPDADFIFLRRRGADNVNSLIQGWRAHPRFVTYELPAEQTTSSRSRDWSFVLIPGWRDLEGAPIEEICARQYVSCNEAVLAGAETVDPRRWTAVSYEDLVARPEEEVARILDRLGLALTPNIVSVAARLESLSINTVTPPKAGKWRQENPEAVARILPIIVETERKLGYEPIDDTVLGCEPVFS
jgi:hypothetical protein